MYSINYFSYTTAAHAGYIKTTKELAGAKIPATRSPYSRYGLLLQPRLRRCSNSPSYRIPQISLAMSVPVWGQSRSLPHGAEVGAVRKWAWCGSGRGRMWARCGSDVGGSQARSKLAKLSHVPSSTLHNLKARGMQNVWVIELLNLCTWFQSRRTFAIAELNNAELNCVELKYAELKYVEPKHEEWKYTGTRPLMVTEIRNWVLPPHVSTTEPGYCRPRRRGGLIFNTQLQERWAECGVSLQYARVHKGLCKR